MTSEPPKPQQPAQSEPEPQAAKPAEPPPNEELEGARREAARIAYVTRQAERKLAEERAALAAENKRIAAEREALEKVRKEEDSLDEIALVEAIAKRRGVGVDDVVRGLIARVNNGGKATVEQQLEQVAKEAREAREYAARLEAELQRQAREEAAAEESARVESFLNGLRDGYAAAIDENHHPYLSLEDPADVAERGLAAANAYVEQGYQMPTAEEVVEYLESVERAKFEAKAQKAGWTRAQAAAAAQQAAAPAPARGVDDSDWMPAGRGGLQFGASADAGAVSLEQGVRRDASGRYVAPAASVTNRDVAARGAAPIDWRNLDERERIRLAAQEVLGGGRR